MSLPIMEQPWVPITWKPIHEVMVALYVKGWTYIEIGEHTGYTSAQVGNIIRSPEAIAVREKFIAKVREDTIEGLPSIIEQMKVKSVQRIQDVINDDSLAEKAPFAQANMAKDFLKGIGFLSDGGAKVQNNQFIVASPELQSDLVKALSESNEVRLLHSDNSKPSGSGEEVK